MAVRLRLKRLGRKNRPFFRLAAMDSRTNRDGKVIEELGHYDPLVPDVNARAIINGERVDYWLSVGALPTESVSALIRKYGTKGTHVDQQKSALEKLKSFKPSVPAPWTPPPKPVVVAETPVEGPPSTEEAVTANE
ncbi:MAG TPA: 30S ribosomal protein S16 [Pirellulaceae bacterium]|nr:30S ribosomal protein S16 [Pirellulaceae bacterium]